MHGEFFVNDKGFINILSRRATGIHRWVKPFELNFFRLSDQPDQIVVTSSQFTRCLALYETPAMNYLCSIIVYAGTAG